MTVGTNTGRPLPLLPLPPQKPRPVPSLKKAPKPSVISAAMRGKRPR
jgi:hypothetical protein